MLDMEERHWEIIKEILSKYPYTFYAFGSRVKHTAQRYSDLDLCYKEPIPSHVLVTLEGEFEDSDLPFTVEFVNWDHCTPDFRALIEKDLIKVK